MHETEFYSKARALWLTRSGRVVEYHSHWRKRIRGKEKLPLGSASLGADRFFLIVFLPLFPECGHVGHKRDATHHPKYLVWLLPL